ncbi:hybrid sensor histidine kinase/response regulator [Fulvitalea axinellae]|uniref:histidine kinase n=1 Tax=Fulvitalea axinellae TaxID=1182444 RepID=A0AAU9CL53_9BACT|nr:hybrid sensor histidine kinase/response regulator [Fulvitalea axinellae]
MSGIFRYKIFWAISLWFCVISEGFAQYDWRVSHISRKDGLAHATVNNTFQDRQGFYWITTGSGMNRFDGKRMENIREVNGPEGKLYIGDSYILAEDKSGRVLALKWGKAFALDRNTGKADPIRDMEGAEIKNVNSILELRNGEVILGTDKGAYRIKDALYAEPFGAFGSGRVAVFTEDDMGYIWFDASGKFLLCSSSSGREIARFGEESLGSVNVASITGIVRASGDTYWLGTMYNGVYEMRRNGGEAKPLEVPMAYAKIIKKIIKDRLGRIWLGSDGGGVYLYDTGEKKWDHVSERIAMESKAVYSLYEDRGGNIWAGMNYGGAYVVEANRGPFDKPEKGNILYKDMRMLSVMLDHTGTRWLGTDGEGIRLVDSLGNISEYTPFGAGSAGAKGFVQGIYEDHAGDVWIGTYTQGLGVYRRATGEFEQFEPSEENGLRERNIKCVTESADGKTLWVGASYGLITMDKEAKTFRSFTYQKGDLKLTSCFVTALLTDRSGALWIGTSGDGLIRLRLEGDEVKDAKRFRKVGTKISHISEDGQGNLWVTGGGTISKIGKADEVKVYTAEDGLPKVWPEAAFADESGRIWIATTNGLSVFDPNKKSSKGFTTYHGLQSSIFSTGAGFQAKDGRLLFAGMRGVNEFYPDRISLDGKYPKVLVDDLKFNGMSIWRDASYRKDSPDGVSSFELPPAQQSLTFDYVLPHFPLGDVEYSYKLSGVDANWVRAGKRQSVTYASLPAGEYVFSVRSSLDESSVSSVRIVKLSPVWLRPWALFGYAVAVLLIIYAYWAYLALKRKVKYEKLQKDRLNELADMKLRFFTNISHELKTPLTLILHPVKRLLEKEKDKDKRDALATISRNADLLLNTVNELLDFNKLESGKYEPQAGSYDLKQTVENVCLLFDDYARQNRFDYRFTCDLKENRLYVFDRDILEKVTVNLISNAFKYTAPQGKVHVHLEFAGGKIYLKVNDNGKGIAKEKLPFIFESFYQANHADRNIGTGIGLALVKRLVESHGGAVRATSEPGNGTELSVELPELELEQASAKVGDGVSAKPVFGENKPEMPEIWPVGEEGKPKLLVVDDNREIRNLVADMMSDRFEVVMAGDGEEGLEKTKAHMPDFIISDVMMPVMDGVEFCSKLREDQEISHIPVILLTAKGTTESEMAGLSAGADDYILKPFDEEILKVKVSTILMNRERLRERYRDFPVSRPRSVTSDANDRFMTDLTDLIDRLMGSGELSVERLAREMAMSHSVLYKKCKALTGKSLAKYIQLTKIHRAAEILRHDDLPIKAVMAEVGFNDPKHFRECFREVTGVLPSEWRKGEKTLTE